MGRAGEEEHSEVSTRTDPGTSSLHMSAQSAQSFVYLNRIHRRAARARTTLATQVLAEMTPDKTPVTDV